MAEDKDPKLLERMILNLIISNKVLDELAISHICRDYKSTDITRILSELVMTNDILRVEYILPDEHTRRAFYMPFGSRLMDV